MPKRKGIPVRTKLAVRLRQKGVCGCRKNCGTLLPPDGNGLVNYQHEPALALRAVLPDDSDWDPPQHDPAFIYAEMAGCHKIETYHPRSKATSLGSDRHAIDKGKRIRGERKPKPKKAWAKGRKLQGKPFYQRKGKT